MKRFLPFLSLLFLTSCLEDPPIIPAADYACTTSENFAHPQEDRFQAFLEEKNAEGLPGISMLLENDEGRWAGSAGQADIANNIDLEICHQHQIGSMTKTFTAVIIMQLVEEGLLALNDSIAPYLDREIVRRVANADRATVRDLLQHSSGIPEFLDIPFSLAAAEQPRRAFTARESMEFIYGVRALFPAGTKVSYSNSNFTLLGLIAEQITGERGDELFQERIFTPLGMVNTYFSQDGSAAMPTGIARAYEDRNDNGRFTDVTEVSAIRTSMAGGVVSTPEDLFRFAQGLFVEGRLVSQATLTAMSSISELPLDDPDIFEYGEEFRVRRIAGLGLGLFILDTDRGIAIGHGGGYAGRRSRMWYFPNSGETIVYLMNSSGGSVKEIGRQLQRNEMMDLLFGI